jgi:hypothetical protein
VKANFSCTRIILKGESNLLIDTNQEEIKSGNCTLKNFLKSLFVLKKVLTFASAFENEGMKNFLSSERNASSLEFPSRERSQGRKALKSSLKDLHKQRQVVQEASTLRVLG